MPMTANGLAKLLEELGELSQVAAKRLAYFHTSTHPDGAGDLNERMQAEMADVSAACAFVVQQFGLDGEAIANRGGAQAAPVSAVARRLRQRARLLPCGAPRSSGYGGCDAGAHRRCCTCAARQRPVQRGPPAARLWREGRVMSGFFNRVEVERLPNLTIVHLIHDMEVECCICGRSTFSKLCVPYYCGPVREGYSEGGYSHACERCYARWERWNDAGMAQLYKPAHGGYPSVPCGMKGPNHG